MRAIVDDYDEFFDSADDMPVALRIVYLGLSVLIGLAAIGVLAILFTQRG